MCSIDNLKIDMKALEEGEHTVEETLNDAFFTSIEGSEINQGDVHVDVSIRKTAHFSEISLHATGYVVITCDRCLDPMDQHIDAEQKLMVKNGDKYSEEDDIITITDDNTVIDMSWYAYEAIVLSLPVKHVHAPGKCNRAMINILQQYSATRSDDTAETQNIDPRWSKLMQLKTDN